MINNKEIYNNEIYNKEINNKEIYNKEINNIEINNIEINMSYIKAYEYQSSVNPLLKNIEITSKNYKDFSNGINFINLSNIYNTNYKATTPNLLSGFINLETQQKIFYDNDTNTHNNNDDFNASSHFFILLKVM